LVTQDGTDFTYSQSMLDGNPNTDILYAGSRKQCEYLQNTFNQG